MSGQLAQEAIRKRRDGAALSEAEEAAYRAYFSKYTQRAAKVYFRSAQELAEYQELAREQGFSTFSKWAVKQIETAATGRMFDPSYVDDLREEVGDLRRKLERERDETEYYRLRARELESKLEEYADEFFRIASEKGT